MLLLALLAGGQGFVTMTMPMAQAEASSAGEAPDAPCKGCVAADAASGACEMLCIGLAAILPGAIEFAGAETQTDWAWQPRSGLTHAISPDTSPPRT